MPRPFIVLAFMFLARIRITQQVQLLVHRVGNLLPISPLLRSIQCGEPDPLL